MLLFFSLSEASWGRNMENARSEICARGRRLSKRKRNTRIYIVSLVSISHSFLSDCLKNAKESGASVYARGRRANKRKKRHENNVPLACVSFSSLPQAIRSWKDLKVPRMIQLLAICVVTFRLTLLVMLSRMTYSVSALLERREWEVIA